MKKIIVIILIIFPILTVAANSKKIEMRKIATDKHWGLTFNLRNLLLSIEEFNDGYQAGAGIKYRFNDIFTLRGLLSFDLLSNDANTTTNFGFAPALEFHFIKGMISPYASLMIGMRLRYDTDVFFDFYFGGSLGVEVFFLNYLSVYAEYILLFSIDENGFGIDLATNNSAQLGITFYF